MARSWFVEDMAEVGQAALGHVNKGWLSHRRRHRPDSTWKEESKMSLNWIVSLRICTLHFFM